jgi:hypothetical protein
MGEATKKLYGTLADADFDTLRRLGACPSIRKSPSPAE